VKTAHFGLILAAFASLMLLVAACGSDDDDANGDSRPTDTATDDSEDNISGASGEDPEIRTTKGLSVAAMNAGFGPQGGGGGDDAGTAESDLAFSGSGGTIGADRAAAPAAAPAGGDSNSVNPQQAGAAGGITITGYGTATADADSAILEFYFGNTNGNPSGTPLPPITEAELQPVIDALVAAGVARDDIEVVSQGYYDAFYRSATLRAKVRDVNIVEAAAQAASDAAGGLSGFSLQSTNITWTLSNCEAMERASLQAATEDAADHGAMLADVLGVGRGAIVAASNQSYPYYWGYGGLDDGVCASTYYGAIPFYSGQVIGGSREVDVFGYVSITYAIQ
jgi:uncharacterized protein YggE